MYIKKIEIENIRSIRHFEWSLDKPDDDLAGWHVLIGDNGSGKSTILKAIAFGLMGNDSVTTMVFILGAFVSHNQKKGEINLTILVDETNKAETIRVKMQTGNGAFSLIEHSKKSEPEWFSASYGPFRRFTGGDSGKYASYSPYILPHLSLFDENFSSIDILDWLKELRFKELEQSPEAHIFPKIQKFINQTGFLPYQVKLSRVTSDGVFFEDSTGVRFPVSQLGDGYRSILSVVLNMIRQMQIAYRTDELFSDDGKQIIMPGVVLIDEVDAHLHPEWQRTIGYWLTEHFPKIQFIVTTHSPLVCQAAVKGSIWRLPAPNSEEEAYQIKPDSEDWKRLVYGDILEAYSTDLFGENIDRSPESQELFKELSQLSVKEMEEPLSSEEENRQAELMAQLPNVPSRDLILSTFATQGDKEDD